MERRQADNPLLHAGVDDLKIERIQQRRSNDCGIAALAMACGVPYEAVQHVFKDGSGDGVNDLDLKNWMIENGWAWQEVFPMRRKGGKYVPREVWPPKPFAPSHIITVQATRDWHFTVMDAAGEVFDPWTPDRKSLDHPDYKSVNCVLGLWRVP